MNPTSRHLLRGADAIPAVAELACPVHNALNAPRGDGARRFAGASGLPASVSCVTSAGTCPSLPDSGATDGVRCDRRL